MPSDSQPAKENTSLLRSLPDKAVGRIWPACIITLLAAIWCVFDSWNHDMSSHLFQMSEVKGLTVDTSGLLRGVLEPFKYTLTLAFLQFAFTGIIFGLILTIKSMSAAQGTGQSLAKLRSTISDGRWPALVGTHMFGSLLLQSLMMPTHMMSLSLFAATRAVEIPVAAAARAKIFGASSEGPSLRTTMLMFGAAWLLFFSYTEIAECLCVFSGFGVALSGAALYFVYALLLTVPAANVVLQESVMVHLEVSPILMLCAQNLCAATLLMPILLGAHLMGYEDVQHAVAMISSHRGVYMTVLWLCVQTAVISMVTVGLILTMDSFWAVALRSLRVVWWWSRQLLMFYLTSGTLLSIARPHASLWSLIMVCGMVLGLSALVTDKRQIVNSKEESSQLQSEGGYTAKGLGIGKYV